LSQSSLSNQNEFKNKQSNKLLAFWGNLELSICLVSMVLMTLITFVQVIGRYVFNHSLGWSEEICRFLVIWITFGGSAYAFRKGVHIGVTALVNIMPSKLRFLINLFSKLATIFFFVVLAYYGWLHTAQQIVNGQVAPATRLPIAIAYSAVPIGSVLVIIRLVEETIREFIKNRKCEVNEV